MRLSVCLSSFGSRDVLLVVISEQEKMLLAQKVSQFRLSRFIQNEPERATFGARFRLAVFQFARFGIFHARNIAVFRTNFSAFNLPAVLQKEQNQRVKRFSIWPRIPQDGCASADDPEIGNRDSDSAQAYVFPVVGGFEFKP